MLAAEKVLDCLTEKWDPRRPDQDDGLALTPENKTRNEEVRETNGRIRFDPDIDGESLLTDGIRVFTSGWDTCSRPAMRETCTVTDDVPEATISIAYTDGSAYNNGTVDARARAGVWFGDDHARNIFLRLPGLHQTNNAAEIRAVLECVLAAIQDETIMTISDSKYIIDGLCFHLSRWENSGWIGVSNSEVWKATVAALHCRGTPIYFEWVKGHSSDTRNGSTDSLAGKGALLNESEALEADTEICHEFDVDSARLSSLTQSQAYKLLWMMKGMKT